MAAVQNTNAAWFFTTGVWYEGTGIVYDIFTRPLNEARNCSDVCRPR